MELYTILTNKEVDASRLKSEITAAILPAQVIMAGRYHGHIYVITDIASNLAMIEDVIINHVFTPIPTSFYLERIESITNNSSTPKEYFTEPQSGTEISNEITAIGGQYDVSINLVCSNSHKQGSIIVNCKVNGSDICSEHFKTQPTDSDNIYYPSINKKINLIDGVNTLEINLSNANQGTATIYEANLSIK